MSGPVPTVAVVESCTGGLVMGHIAATPGSGDWFKGGVVAYDKQVKFDLLGLEPGPVVTAPAAARMAAKIRRLIGADLGLATTGEMGPEAEEDVPVGTLFVGVADGQTSRAHHILLSGSPDQIRASATEIALLHLRRRAGLDVRLKAV
ncbi:MAG TPA: CinA family protein [Acidimicrobiia bacterium]|nr:CinA family protein [Acidimicrobiia bacterium]